MGVARANDVHIPVEGDDVDIHHEMVCRPKTARKVVGRLAEAHDQIYDWT